ncbi:MAG: diacylglycerol kinase family lipid kinase [Eubacteriales bacterium]|nr:diacylglycerol kinase family lipid kinase [Eubacteriales bacterium]
MYYFIVNPNSRSGKGALIWKDLRKTLRDKNISYKAVFTEYRGHAVKLAASVTENASPEHPVTLIAVGGDGTIQEVLSGVRNLSCIYFGYIPTGSGNDFCRSMKLPQDPHEALNCVLEQKHIASMDVPVISINGHQSHFAISCGIGFDAAVCHEVSVTPMKKVLNHFGLGKLVYLFVALKQLLFMKPLPMTLQMDNKRVHQFQKVYFSAVMNQKYEGGGFKFCPAADPSDGYLDVIVIDGLSKLKVLFCLPTAFFGKHTHITGIHIFRCKNVEIFSSVPLAVHKDGESAGIRKTFSASIEKEPVKIILP